MKKIIALSLAVLMALTLLTGCSDPVADDLKNFINNEMTEVNANYEKITAEVGTWETLADDSAIAASINDVLLPLVDDSVTKLDAIAPATEEVTELKTKYAKIMESYKAAFVALAEGCETQDDATIEEGNAKLEEALKFLDEYNAALEELAVSFDMEVSY